MDNGTFDDWGEPSNSCGSYRSLATIGSLDPTVTYNDLNLYPLGDVDYYRIQANETDSVCHSCGGPLSFDEDHEFEVGISVPVGAGSFQLCASTDCASVDLNCTTVQEGQNGTVSFVLDGSCSASAAYDIFVKVKPGNAPGHTCKPYELTYSFIAGCFD